MKSITSKIVRSLNEAMENPSNAPVVANEETVGTDTPKAVHQCEECSKFYLVNESVDVSQCPECGGPGKVYQKLKEADEIEKEPEQKPELTEEEEELKSEADLVVSEALRLLDHNDYRKFNESYRPRVRVTRRGELEALVESSKGGFVTARRRMTSRQKTAYKLSEKYTPAVKSPNKRLESIKLRRQELLIKNESRAIKLKACRILERLGATYNHKKFNESLSKFINERLKRVHRVLEDISDEEEMGKEELEQMDTDDIADQVESVVKDTGLDVISKDVDIDGDTATVDVRVEDDDDAEVHTSELEEVLKEVFNKPVEIVGPNVSEGDKSVADLSVVINPDDAKNEDMDEEEPKDPEVPAPNPEDQEKDPELPEDLEDPEEDELHKDNEEEEEDLLGECDDPRKMRRNESFRRRRRSRMNEKFVKGTGEKPLFALLSNAAADNAPEFLAQDDSMVSGNEEKAEDLARIFVSEEAARQYLDSAGIADKFTPVSITIVTNESLEDSAEEVYECDGQFFKKDKDGNKVEISESEFDAKKDMSSEVDRIKESMKRRRHRRR